MFGLLKKKAGEFVKQVSQVSGQQRRPVEIFKDLWAAVQDEHLELVRCGDLNLDDPKVLGKSSIPDDLDAMVSLLIREDLGLIPDTNTKRSPRNMGGDDSNRLDDGGRHGPLKACLEYTLENKVFSDLCAMGLADRPRGMMRLIVIMIHRLIDKIRHPLLPYKTAHQPLSQLVRVTSETGDEQTQRNLVSLLKTLWLKMQRDPSQLDFFFTPETRGNKEKLDLFNALLPFVLNMHEIGYAARYSVLCLSTIPDTHLLNYVAHETNLCGMIANGLVVAFQKALAIRADLDSGSHTQEVIKADDDLINIWCFANALSVPGVMVAINPQESVVEHYEPQDAHVKSPCEILSNQILLSVGDVFLKGVLFNSLIETSEVTARDAMHIVSNLLRSMAHSGQELYSPLLWELISMLIPTDLDVDTRSDKTTMEDSQQEGEEDVDRASKIARLHSVLLFRLDSMAPHLSKAALKLYSALLDLNDPRVLHSLVLRQLYPGNHLCRAAKFKTDDETGHTTPKKIKPGPGASGAISFLDNYPGSPIPPPRNQGKTRKDMSRQEGEDLASFEAYLTDGQGEAAAKIAAFSSVISTTHTSYTSPCHGKKKPVDSIETDVSLGESPFHEGLFISLLFNKMERMLDNSLEENLVLTGILAKFAQCPHKLLHSYFYDESISGPDFAAACDGMAYGERFSKQSKIDLLAVKKSVRTPSSVLATVWKEALERADDVMPEFEQQRKQTRTSLGVDSVLNEAGEEDYLICSNSAEEGCSPSRLRFIQAYIVLEEFLKELASILQAKQNLTPLALELTSK
mmetsp:Transcript_8012/g.12930  ORF Transcript_8012/g.12930 Transcript_8012/m.12930 type:complete len:799 (+) Transcript_8012:169-2565(+)